MPIATCWRGIALKFSPVPIQIAFLLGLLLIPAFAPATGVVELPVRDSLGNIKAAALVRPDPDGVLEPLDLLASDEGFVDFDPGLNSQSPPVWLKFHLSATA